jgi:hypothetical protein
VNVAVRWRRLSTPPRSATLGSSLAPSPQPQEAADRLVPNPDTACEKANGRKFEGIFAHDQTGPSVAHLDARDFVERDRVAMLEEPIPASAMALHDFPGNDISLRPAHRSSPASRSATGAHRTATATSLC